MKYSLNDYVQMISELYNGYFPYEILNPNDYKNSKSIMKIKCKKCDYIMERKMYDLYSKCKFNNEKQKGMYVCKECNRSNLNNYLNKRSNIGKENFYKNMNKYYPNQYEFLSEYTKKDSKIKLRCKTCNTIFEATPTNLLSNIRLKREYYCPKCSHIKIGKSLKKDIEYFKKKLIEKEGSLNYEIKEIEGNKYNFKCLICNYNFNANIYNVLKSKKHYCPKCNKLIRDKRPYKERIKIVSKNKIIPIDNYVNLKTPIRHKCLVCNTIWKITPNNILRGEGCPICNKAGHKSKNENSLANYIKSIYDKKIILGSRLLIKPQELDIYIPNKKLAIEYCGLYWHGEFQKEINYHLDKTKKCLEHKDDNGNEDPIRLIHIFEDEWLNNEKLVKEKIKYILGLSKAKRLYARSNNSYIKEINTKKKNKFLNKYHLQGEDKSSIKLGLYIKSPKTKKYILVSVMTFCKPRRALGQGQNNKKYDYELSRFASTYNYVILNGFSKLFSYFKENYEWNNLITYTDRRWSQGDVYIKNGWKFDHNSKPNYWYVNNSYGFKRFHRYNYRKSNLKNLFPKSYDDNKSEHEIMLENKFYRIYDCGNMIFTYSKSS